MKLIDDSPFKKIFCELCDKEVDKAQKYEDDIWICEPCNKEYPIKKSKGDDAEEVSSQSDYCS